MSVFKLASSQLGCPAGKVMPQRNPLSVPPPLFVTLTVWDGGVAPPCVALKLMLEGLSAMAGAGGFTTRVTVTV
jgi:hypothetical protein